MYIPRLVLLLALTSPVRVVGQSPQLVDVGDHRLDVLRAGSGTPAIIFEAGLGGVLDDWSPVWPGATLLSTVVSYSRAGLGRSEPGPNPPTARSAAVDLHALLARLDLKPPYVLVGRSYGGILVRLYTSLYPGEVAGLVLVDGSHEQQVRRWGLIDSTYPNAFRAYFDSMLQTMKPGAEADETRESLRIQTAGALEGLLPVPDVPIAVLTSMKVDTAAKYVNGTARGHEAWRAMHDEWLQHTGNGLHITTTRSGHAIQHDEPQLVLDAIRFVFGAREDPLMGAERRYLARMFAGDRRRHRITRASRLRLHRARAHDTPVRLLTASATDGRARDRKRGRDW